MNKSILAPNVARIAHELNRVYCEEMGDSSQLPWEDAPGWQRDSALKGVEFHVENPGSDGSASHESWLREKEAAGWVYGPVKDEGKKEHPCMVGYLELPLEQRVKDHLFSGVVDALRGLIV